MLAAAPTSFAAAQLIDCTDLFVWIEFPYQQKCQRLSPHVSCKRGTVGLDPRLGVDRELLDRLQQAVRIRVGDPSGDFVLRNFTLYPAAIKVYRYRHEGFVGRFRRRKRMEVRPR